MVSESRFSSSFAVTFVLFVHFFVIQVGLLIRGKCCDQA